MNPKLPRCTSKDLMRALHRAGWCDDHQVGSHLALVHPTKPGRIIIPVHPGKTLKLGTLSRILEQAGLSPDELRRLL